MGDHRVIAAVTATFRHILEEAVREVSNDARVRVTSVPGPGSKPEVRVCLVQAEPNRGFRLAGLPTRSSAGELVARPQVALDLYYLIAFEGDPESLLPERLLGACVSRLEAQAAPEAAVIEAAIQRAAGEGVALEGCGLAEQVGTLRFVPVEGLGEEPAGLRSAFLQGQAALSVAYRCTVLLPVPDLPRTVLSTSEPLAR